MYVPFLLLCGLIKQNRQWGYFGSVAVTTGLIVSLGRNAYLDPLVGDYSLLRIQQNVMGILLSLACSFITVPVFAIDLLKLNIVSVFGDLSKSTGKVLEVYNSMINSVAVVAAVTVAQKVDSKEPENKSVDVMTSEGDEAAAADADAVMVKGNLDGITVVDNSEKILIIAYIESEGALIRSKLSQQPLLIEQAAMELIFWSKPFPEESYIKLIACQTTVLRLVVSIDRALLRITRFTHVKLAAHSMQFSQKVSGLVSELLNEVLANLDRWSDQVKATVVNDSTEEGECKKAALKITRPESRAEHAKGMERMHQVALKVADNCLRFNNDMMRDWLESMRGTDSPTVKGSGAEEKPPLSDAEIHRLFDILTTFNALFYASSHLASAAMDMGNIVYTILLLERKRNHKQF